MPKRPRLELIFAALLGLAPAAIAEPVVELLGSYTWSEPGRDFGGLSGIEITEGGTRFTAISDRGGIWTGDLIREEDQITGVTGTSFATLLNDKGVPLTRFQTDAEGLAIRPDGRILISFEAVHRVWSYANPTATADPMPRHPDFEVMQNNSSLEALALDAGGAVYTLPERSGRLDRPFPVYRFAKGKWTRPFGLRRAEPFLPAGADFGPDGKLYLLERHLSGILGFQTRVRRFTIEGDKVTGEETLIETSTGTHDNLEGISVWTDEAGAIRITMISDDNFRAFQKTEFVEYRITE